MRMLPSTKWLNTYHLDAAGLLRLALACKAFHKALLRSRYLWRRLSLDLLGEPLVQLHLSAWRAADSARFHRRLVRAALEGELAYANTLRSAVVGRRYAQPYFVEECGVSFVTADHNLY